MLSVPLALACGPWFPSTILDDPNSLLVSPVGDFYSEVKRIVAGAKAPFRAVVNEDPNSTYAAQTAGADVADLKAALAAARGDKREQERVLKDYAAAREDIRSYAAKVADWEEKGGSRDDANWVRSNPPPKFLAPHVATALPREFALYTEGAVAWHGGEPDKAVAAWQKLLKLPAEQRKYRSTWAAYMLGQHARRQEPKDPNEAGERFRQVQHLAAAGYRDSLGLAAASLGWEARAELDRKDYLRSLELYVQQLAAGDDSADMSLRLVAEKILIVGGPLLAEAARHETARRIVTAYIVCNGGPTVSTKEWEGEGLAWPAEKWLAAVEAAGVKDMPGASRLAWAAYLNGRMKDAQRWADRAPGADPVAEWVRAKLLLRAGKIDEAARHLEQAAKLLPKDEQWIEGGEDYSEDGVIPAHRAAAELAGLRMARGKYVEALDLLLHSGFWTDAAYVAERVLTADELKAYVDANWPAPKKEAKHAEGQPWAERGSPIDRGELSGAIRYLLARRLTRAGQWKDARPYCPAEMQKKLDEYAEAISGGADHSRLDVHRAKSLWQAARIARHFGMALLGTEVEPDWRLYGGDFELGDTTGRRGKPDAKLARYVTEEEKQRLERHKLTFEKRFHYRYIATEHAWAAAKIMPNDFDETAKVLCAAGTWLKTRDPKAAERFYKALVLRCGKTALGQQAAAMKWFPKVEE
jgi:tetratricopeptide (TPR) repeat protein